MQSSDFALSAKGGMPSSGALLDCGANGGKKVIHMACKTCKQGVFCGKAMNSTTGETAGAV
jgi:hypothetical protein